MLLEKQLKVAATVKRFGQVWEKVSQEVGIEQKECQQIYQALSPSKFNELIQIRRKQIEERLEQIEKEYQELFCAQIDAAKQFSDMEMSESNDRKKPKSTWQKTANMIWHKIADHRAGNAFLKPNKSAEYSKIVKQPMCLETVKSRIRSKVTLNLYKKIASTAEFHRDVMHVIANAVMYNHQNSDFYEIALELKEYTDGEMQNFLILHP
jgi:hypothetical protein